MGKKSARGRGRGWRGDAIFLGRKGGASEVSSMASATVPASEAVGQRVQRASCAPASSEGDAERQNGGSAGRGLGGGETPSFVHGRKMAGSGDLGPGLNFLVRAKITSFL